MHTRLRTMVLGGFTLLGLMFSPVALAHTGNLATSLLPGLLHPFTGTDHLLMIIGVGIYSARSNNPLRFALPCVYLLALTTGALFGTNTFSAAAIEVGVAVSLLALGLLLMLAGAAASIWTLGIVTFTGVVSGLAHGLEIPSAVAGAAFIAGLLTISTALLIACLWISALLAPIEIESSPVPITQK